MNFKRFSILLLLESLAVIGYFSFKPRPAPISNHIAALPPVSLTPTLAPPTPTPTTAPLTFAQLNSTYGPCVHLPTLMYHHIQNPEPAKAQGHPGLAVSPHFFELHLNYLRSHGYSPVKITDLINFFNSRSPLPPKPVLLTFDDGYDDFFTSAYPLLRQYNIPAVMFLPTGLLNNSGYLTWDNISAMSGSGLVYFANHTWSHRQLNTSSDVINRELTTSATQLTDHHQDLNKVFAYPYGVTSSLAITDLSRLGYQLAFTTRPGSTLCRGQRLYLPRVRVANADLSRYGL